MYMYVCVYIYSMCMCMCICTCIYANAFVYVYVPFHPVDVVKGCGGGGLAPKFGWGGRDHETWDHIYGSCV